MKINPEVKKALKEGKPVVALESTIISHGMPYPKNVNCALQVERTIRKYGAIPATIGIINGEPIIGMTAKEIESFGKKFGITKVSRRDIPYVIASKQWGATTVSATMIFAAKAGIEFFVTGGIGGAQKGVEETFDISADLEELGKTNVTVICAGPKAILNIPVTLEILETKGVTVIGYQCDNLPAFYTRTSKFKVDYRVNSAKEIAVIHKTKKEYGLGGGLLVTNPIPGQYAMNEKDINAAINKAQKQMELRKIKGKEQTPYLLSKIVELTSGSSLEANIQLILNNAKLGAQIAKEYSELKK